MTTTTYNTIDKHSVQLRLATQQAVKQAVALLNRCYRCDEGWTNEAALIGGIPATLSQIKAMIDSHHVNKMKHR